MRCGLRELGDFREDLCGTAISSAQLSRFCWLVPLLSWFFRAAVLLRTERPALRQLGRPAVLRPPGRTEPNPDSHHSPVRPPCRALTLLKSVRPEPRSLPDTPSREARSRSAIATRSSARGQPIAVENWCSSRINQS